MYINKSMMSNLASIALLIVGMLIIKNAEALAHTPSSIPTIALLGVYTKNAGLFALSGAFTNWLAIYMLFEKVPLLYGSGVIPNNFLAFKTSLRTMILENFFNEKNFDKLSHQLPKGTIPTESIMQHVDEDALFQSLLDAVHESSLGSMLKLIGGTSILEPLRVPFKKKIRIKIEETIRKIDFSLLIDSHFGFEALRPKIEILIDARLDELTATHVKEIVAKMIRIHLGWLVVWGAVFGGLLGILSTWLSVF